jgi:hypothetical protein
MTRVLTVILAGLTTGCLTLNGKELPRRDLPERVERPPVIALEVGEVHTQLNGRETSFSIESPTAAGRAALSRVVGPWKRGGLVSAAAMPGSLRDEPDFKLSVSGTQNEQGSMALHVISGLLYLLIPVADTMHYDWKFTLTDLRTGTTYPVPASHSMTNWLHLFLLPALPIAPVGRMAANRDLSHYVYTELDRQGAWAQGTSREQREGVSDRGER